MAELETLVLRQEDVRRIFEIVGRDHVMTCLIERLSDGLGELGRGECPNSPPRAGFTRGAGARGVIDVMPHYLPGSGLTVKTISYNPNGRREANLPTVLGSIARIDEASGAPIAICDAVLLTAVRTGAASAIASRLFALPKSRTVGVVGAGAQAVTQLHGLSLLFDIDTVLVHDVSPVNAKSLKQRASFIDCEFKTVSPHELLASSDIIFTATSVVPGAGPVIPDVEHLPHLHINSIGADEVGKTELPVSMLRRAYVCVDHPEQARTEGESQQLEPEEIGLPLSYFCAHPEDASKHMNSLTVFDSTGFAWEDHIAMDVFLELARDIGLGEKVSIVHCPEDVHNPYDLSSW
ncbi:ornithine cyclodeaminase family protein [Nocardia ninae]|uniref:ornithine cyclodeaminase family protein n=1 Tax=Nocardia ninae TaxID=356145 RepID=UPI001C99876C|nr:hypothetical protein [Nocardia ninae]